MFPQVLILCLLLPFVVSLLEQETIYQWHATEENNTSFLNKKLDFNESWKLMVVFYLLSIVNTPIWCLSISIYLYFSIYIHIFSTYNHSSSGFMSERIMSWPEDVFFSCTYPCSLAFIFSLHTCKACFLALVEVI